MDPGTYDIRQARATASLKWLLSKAFNNRVPENLREPYYRDIENQERLKPQIIIELGNATLYCQALSNLYSDPNYQSLNHWAILQTLTRKGVAVGDVSDMPLTETILIQTNPLKINAHLSVIESIMALYAKEIASNDRIATAIKRISSQFVSPPSMTYEQSLLLWISHCCAAIKNRIMNEREINASENTSRMQSIDIPTPRDFKDLCDGVCLALLLSYYCPKVVLWSSIRINYLPALEDSIHNMLIIKNFVQNYLPYNIFHTTPEDIIYFGGPMKLNLIVLLSDLFNLFEIHPAKCVSYPGMESKEDILRRNNGTNEYGIMCRRGRTVQPVTPIPDLRTELPPTSSPTNRPPFQDFIVHKSRGITTLASVHYQQTQQQDPLMVKVRQSKENSQLETKSDEKGDVPAGRPSHWDQNRRPSYAGRRSRRNSSSEDSQLTIENFGGSQDQLHNFGRFDRERESKIPNTAIETVLPARSSIADARGTLQLGYDTDSGSEKQDCETEKYRRNQGSTDNISMKSCNGNNYNQPNQVVETVDKPCTDDKGNASEIPRGESPPQENFSQDLFDDNLRSFENASKLCAIRMKLEEKQRRIEQEKRRIELALLRHEEKALHDDIDNAQWETWSNESKRTPEIEPVEFDKYQQNIAVMNMNLQDIQQDIQRLATQQTQIQAQQMQAQQLMQAQQILNQQQLYGSQQHIPDSYQHRAMQQQQSFGSNPHLNTFTSRPPSRDLYQQMSNLPMQYINEQGQYMLHQNMKGPQNTMNPQQISTDVLYNNHQYNNSQYGSQHKQLQPQYMPPSVCDDYPHKNDMDRPGSIQSSPYYMQDVSTPHAQRRTWSKSSFEQQHPLVDVNAWQAQNTSNTQTNINNHQIMALLQNGVGESQYSFPTHYPSYSGVQRQHSMTNLQGNHSPNLMKKTSTKRPTDDMMAPQSICFIGDEDDVDEIERDIIESMHTTCLQDNLNQTVCNEQLHNLDESERDKFFANNININSGNLTYRIPSPSRPQLNAQSFQDPQDSGTNEKGFYISFDDEQPKRPKPPLRTKRSPKKENSTKIDSDLCVKRESLSNVFNKNEFGNKLCESSSKEHTQKSAESNNIGEFNATYNKYIDPPINPLQLFEKNQLQYDRRHLEDVTNQSQQTISLSPMNLSTNQQDSNQNGETKNKALVIGSTVTDLDPESVDEMERRKEKIMLLSLQRRQQQEEVKARKEIEAAKKREREREKEDERARKKGEQIARRAAILEQHRLKKALEEAEREGKTIDRIDTNTKQQSHNNSTTRLRPQKVTRRRPNTIHVDDGSLDIRDTSTLSSRSKKGSNINLTGIGQTSTNSMKRDYYKGSQDSLAAKVESPAEYQSTNSTPIGRRGSSKASRETRVERDQTLSRISVAKGSTLYLRGRKSNSLMNLCETDSGLGRATPPRRAPSPGIGGRHTVSVSGPGSLPPGLISKRRGYDDGSSDVSSSQNSIMEYSGPKLYKLPAAKSNRGIILNAVEYCVFPGVVNRDAKQKVLEKIARSEAKHFLVLFRDAGCQFRALYSYVPETDQVTKLYGTGPSQVDEVMFDKFFKYNSGGKCFSQVHTKHLTVTIDAFTIHNSLWQGKKVQLPSKRDMALVI